MVKNLLVNVEDMGSIPAQEDSTCQGKLSPCTATTEARPVELVALQQEKPLQCREAQAQLESHPLSCTRESLQANNDPAAKTQVVIFYKKVTSWVECIIRHSDFSHCPDGQLSGENHPRQVLGDEFTPQADGFGLKCSSQFLTTPMTSHHIHSCSVG